ncbi:uncharacterized protein BKA55DRAFT_600439 [Fusarium redolens]|uniref:Uncharacterized protein n=1 Tax=Fusarium redolens TaxID=48865 RepID=A0A9P9FW31_FUSRE|nr:uncharacterized protein BKA55DRAFT_600439 [Fusarium redolens]KAH7203153.1 hypothetical protein BKA55DRAFT_600439 [Fusarium redolens]
MSRHKRALILVPDLKYLPPGPTSTVNEGTLSLKSSIQSCLSKIPDALLYDNTATLHGSEMGSSISQAFRRQRPHTDPLSSLNQRKAHIHGLADAQDPQVNLVSSWGQGARNRPLPPTPHPMSKSALETLEINLIRQNGMMRQSIALNRKLVYRVLLRLVSQIRQLASALGSVVTEANLLIEQLNTDWRQYIEDVIKEETDPEIQDSGIDLACSLDAKYHAGNIDHRSESRLRDSGISLSYEPDSMEPNYIISDHIPRSATQAGGRDFNSLNSPSMNRGSLNMGKSKEDQGQSWPYVEPLRIAHQKSQPSPGCDTVSSKAKLRQRLAMLHYERMYYRRLANEAVVRFVPTIKHHVHKVQNLLHEYSTEENRLRSLLQQQINLRTTEHSTSDG